MCLQSLKYSDTPLLQIISYTTFENNSNTADEQSKYVEDPDFSEIDPELLLQNIAIKDQSCYGGVDPSGITEPCNEVENSKSEQNELQDSVPYPGKPKADNSEKIKDESDGMIF